MKGTALAEKDSSRPQQSARVKDARDRPVTPLDPYELNLLRRHDVIPAEILRRIAAQVGLGVPKGQRRAYFAFGLVFLGIWAFLFIWQAVRGSGLDTLARILGSVGVMLFAIGAVVFWWGGRRARARRICAIMLEHLRCPHCGYDLRLLPTDSTDGTTVCPECGCAWKINDPCLLSANELAATEGSSVSSTAGSARRGL